MARRLLSSLTNLIKWRLVSRAIVCAVALFLTYLLSFSFLAVVGFFFILLWAYLLETPDRRSFRFSFWLLQVLFLVALGSIPAPAPILAIYAILMFFLLGLMNSVFVNRSFVYSLFSTVTLLCFFAVLFYGVPLFSLGSVWDVALWFLADFAVVYFSFREYADVLGQGPEKKLGLYGCSLGFVSSEISALAAFLPLGFLNAAAFLTMLILIAREVIFAHRRGVLNLSLVLREVTIFVVVSSVIFATASWRI